MCRVHCAIALFSICGAMGCRLVWSRLTNYFCVVSVITSKPSAIYSYSAVGSAINLIAPVFTHSPLLLTLLLLFLLSCLLTLFMANVKDIGKEWKRITFSGTMSPLGKRDLGRCSCYRAATQVCKQDERRLPSTFSKDRWRCNIQHASPTITHHSRKLSEFCNT